MIKNTKITSDLYNYQLYYSIIIPIFVKHEKERMNCTQQYVSKILKGKENMSLDTLSKLEDALGINLIYDEQVTNIHMVAEEVLA